METEQTCTDIITEYLSTTDPARETVFYEIGCGTFAYTFTALRPLGFLCNAVEPFPMPVLVNACKGMDVALFQGVISDADGATNIYKGGVPDTSSLNGDWWGVTAESVRVRSRTLAQCFGQWFLEAGKSPFAMPATKSISFPRRTAVKMDVEGAELNILSGLSRVKHLPQLIMFEYGGGATRAEGIKGWSPAYLERTMTCLQILKNCGYKRTMIVENNQAPVTFDLQTSDITPELFLAESNYGNILVFR